MSSRSTDTLTKKMISNGSIDSMEKSAYNSSIEDNQSYDIYEAHNPNPSSFAYNQQVTYSKSPVKYQTQYSAPANYDALAFKNEGFRDNSTFATNSRAESVQESTVNDETPIIHSQEPTNTTSFPPSEYYKTDTLPLRNHYLDELKERMPNRTSMGTASRNLMDLPMPPEPPKNKERYEEKLEDMRYSPEERLYSTEFDAETEKPLPKSRCKSEVFLETNFDCDPDNGNVQFVPISEAARSKSQPLETAM